MLQHEPGQNDAEPTDEQRARRRRIRRWRDEALAMGISEDEFIREMTAVVGLEELENALDEEDDDPCDS